MAKEKVTAVSEKAEDLKPIEIWLDGNFEYLLDFDRDSVKFAEGQGLKPQMLNGDLGYTEIETLFYCAFRKNHPKVSRAETNRILKDDLGGLTVSMLVRLCQLFQLPYDTLVIEDGATPKNERMTVKF